MEKEKRVYVKIRDQQPVVLHPNTPMFIVDPMDNVKTVRAKKMATNDRIVLNRNILKSSKENIVRDIVYDELKPEIDKLMIWTKELQRLIPEEQLGKVYDQFRLFWESQFPQEKVIVFDTFKNWYYGETRFPDKNKQLAALGEMLQSEKIIEMVYDESTYRLRDAILSLRMSVAHTLLKQYKEVSFKMVEEQSKKKNQLGKATPKWIKEDKSSISKKTRQLFRQKIISRLNPNWIEVHYFLGTIAEIEIHPVKAMKIRHEKNESIQKYSSKTVYYIEKGDKIYTWKDRNTPINFLIPYSRDAVAPRKTPDFSEVTGHNFLIYLERTQKMNRNVLFLWLLQKLHLLEFKDLLNIKTEMKVITNMIESFLRNCLYVNLHHVFRLLFGGVIDNKTTYLKELEQFQNQYLKKYSQPELFEQLESYLKVNGICLTEFGFYFELDPKYLEEVFTKIYPLDPRPTFNSTLATNIFRGRSKISSLRI